MSFKLYVMKEHDAALVRLIAAFSVLMSEGLELSKPWIISPAAIFVHEASMKEETSQNRYSGVNLFFSSKAYPTVHLNLLRSRGKMGSLKCSNWCSSEPIQPLRGMRQPEVRCHMALDRSV